MEKEVYKRPRYQRRVEASLQNWKITVLLGPRQCGKTTLARMFLGPSEENYFDVSDPFDRSRLEVDPMLLGRCSGLVVVDEVQLLPELFSVLRVLADRDPQPARFLLLGSASPTLRNRVTETLAGRASLIDMWGFDCDEVGWEMAESLWLRGSFPESFLHPDPLSFEWRESFVRLFLERDLPQLGIRIPAPKLRRFWTLLAHEHGQTWNSSKIANAMGISPTTSRDYLDILEQTYMLRVLQPYFSNTKKRLVKSPKVYLRDAGILHLLMGIKDRHGLTNHPIYGFSWEGFAMEQILETLEIPSREAFFWRTHAGAELDLLVEVGGRRFGFEFKRSSAPKTNKSMRSALADLELAHLWIVYPGDKLAKLDESISVLPFAQIARLPALCAEC